MAKPLNAIVDSHADLFHPRFNGPEFLGGWAELLDDILNEWRRRGGPPITQAKEKFGTLRIYREPMSDPTGRQLSLLAMSRSKSICEICGREGRVVRRKGIVATRCDIHADEGLDPVET